ncbi:MAG: hypothetical protein IKM52_03920, partial [Clostridia bacterium]|nr:hypothetical protein [Clostridia bacterium]
NRCKLAKAITLRYGRICHWQGWQVNASGIYFGFLSKRVSQKPLQACQSNNALLWTDLPLAMMAH